jgi:hypothetical protein
LADFVSVVSEIALSTGRPKVSEWVKRRTVKELERRQARLRYMYDRGDMPQAMYHEVVAEVKADSPVVAL